MTAAKATEYANSLDLTSAERAGVAALLTSGAKAVCGDCGFLLDPGAACDVCESAWADAEAEREEERSWSRCDLAFAEF